MGKYHKDDILKWVLRLGGGSLLVAFAAVFLPTALMADIHTSLGLGPFPDAPIVQYLTRSVAGFYAVHGGILLVAAHRVKENRTLISYLGFSNIVFGILLIAIDIKAGMPIFWTLLEGPPVMLFGVILLYLNREMN